MSLNLMYITNRPEVAQLAQTSGVDRIFVDMEYIGKDARQAGMDTVKSHHTFDDIRTIKQAINGGSSRLLVRINPIHDATADYCSTEEEIDNAIECGADILMLPMFKRPGDVERFLTAVDGRVATLLLLETKEAVESVDQILAVKGFDEVHIGLNDLHLAYKKKFMFELYVDGTLDWLTSKLREQQVRFGIGGIARIGHGMLPAEYVIGEHYRLGSKMAILSRSFCDANKATDLNAIRSTFIAGVEGIRAFERKAAMFTRDEFALNHDTMARIVNEIVAQKSN